MIERIEHAGGRAQILLHGVYPRSINQSNLTGRAADPEGKQCTDVHCARIVYDREYPGVWDFE